MKSVLANLNKNPGIRGSMVMTEDGIMVAEAFGPDLEDDVVAALASALLTTLTRSLAKLNMTSRISELSLTATEGKIVFVNLGNAYLIVVAKHDLELDSTMVEIKSAAHHITHRRVDQI